MARSSIDEISQAIGELHADVRNIREDLKKVDGNFIRVVEEQTRYKNNCFNNVSSITKDLERLKTENRLRYLIAGGSGGSIVLLVELIKTLL